MSNNITIDEINNTPVKILGISGSPRKGTTDYLTQLALEEAAKIPGVEVEFIPLHKYRDNLRQCIQCEACLKLEEGHPLSHLCSIYDDAMEELIPKFINADGYIIASPVYEMTYTPLLGNFMGRLRPLFRCYNGLHKNKVGGSISVGGTRHGGQENTCQGINNFFLLNGMFCVSGDNGGYTGACVWSKDKLPKELDDDLGIAKVKDLGRRVGKLTRIVKYGRLVTGDPIIDVNNLDKFKGGKYNPSNIG
jgi:multimeric flavodoxin WrbA